MAEKLKPSQIEKLKKLKVKSTDAAKAKEELIKLLEKESIERSIVEDESIDTLIDMLSELADINVDDEDEEEFAEESETEEGDEEEEYNNLAEEVEGEEEAEEEEEEEVEDLEEEEEAPAKPAAKKTATPAKPTVPAKKPIAPVKPAVKVPAPKAPTANVGADSGNRFDARNNKKHLALLDAFKDYFPEKEYTFDILKNGFTIRKAMKNNRPTIINFDELKIVDGELFGNLYANRFKSPEELIETIGEAWEEREIGMFRGESHPCIRKITQAEVFDIFDNTDFIEKSIGKAGDLDKKLGQSKVKLEESLASKSKAPVKKK